MGSSPANPTTVQALTKVSAFLFLFEGERGIFPIPEDRECPPGRAGAFLPPSAAGELLPGGSRGLQKGVQDTTKDVVSYTPSCDSP